MFKSTPTRTELHKLNRKDINVLYCTIAIVVVVLSLHYTYGWFECMQIFIENKPHFHFTFLVDYWGGGVGR